MAAEAGPSTVGVAEAAAPLYTEQPLLQPPPFASSPLMPCLHQYHPAADVPGSAAPCAQPLAAQGPGRQEGSLGQGLRP